MEKLNKFRKGCLKLSDLHNFKGGLSGCGSSCTDMTEKTTFYYDRYATTTDSITYTYNDNNDLISKTTVTYPTKVTNYE